MRVALHPHVSFLRGVCSWVGDPGTRFAGCPPQPHWRFQQRPARRWRVLGDQYERWRWARLKPAKLPRPHWRREN